MAELTVREQGLKAIEDGGSFFWKGVQYTKKNKDLIPSEAEFAEGNAQATEVALTAMDAQMKQLLEAMEKLKATRPEEPKVVAKEVTKAEEETAKPSKDKK